jgi:predicted glycosyltransferase
MSQKKIWIDLDNSPHVLFFNPIIKELKKRGIDIIITARDYAQVFELLDLFQIEYIKVGKHPGKSRFLKLIWTFARAVKLATMMRRHKPNLAISHGVRAQIIASALLRIKCAIAYDYEFAKPIPFFSADYRFIPEAILRNVRKKKKIKTITFPGIKEDVYVPSFTPDPATKNILKGIDFNKIIITIRPPATLAHYYTEKSRDLFKSLMNYLIGTENTILIITPRTNDQSLKISQERKKEIDLGKIFILDTPINGLDLLWVSDLAISGGGTMIREAAALGVPAYSTFGGEIGGVDQYLEKEGRLVLLQSENDIREKIVLKKREIKSLELLNENNVLGEIINKLLEIEID